MVRNRIAALIPLLIAVGCVQQTSSPESLTEEVLKKIVPAVANAKSVIVVASSPTSSEPPTVFAITVANALAERIASGGLAPDTSPEVRVHSSLDDAKADSTPDIAVYFDVDEYQLEGEFQPDRVAISKKFKAKGWIYATEADPPFEISTGFDHQEKASGPAPDEAASPLSWESFGYSSDSDQRLETFADECADAILKTFHETSSQIRQPK